MRHLVRCSASSARAPAQLGRRDPPIPRLVRVGVGFGVEFGARARARVRVRVRARVRVRVGARVRVKVRVRVRVRASISARVHLCEQQALRRYERRDVNLQGHVCTCMAHARCVRGGCTVDAWSTHSICMLMVYA